MSVGLEVCARLEGVEGTRMYCGTEAAGGRSDTIGPVMRGEADINWLPAARDMTGLPETGLAEKPGGGTLMMDTDGATTEAALGDEAVRVGEPLPLLAGDASTGTITLRVTPLTLTLTILKCDVFGPTSLQQSRTIYTKPSQDTLGSS